MTSLKSDKILPLGWDTGIVSSTGISHPNGELTQDFTFHLHHLARCIIWNLYFCSVKNRDREPWQVVNLCIDFQYYDQSWDLAGDVSGGGGCQDGLFSEIEDCLEIIC